MIRKLGDKVVSCDVTWDEGENLASANRTTVDEITCKANQQDAMQVLGISKEALQRRLIQYALVHLHVPWVVGWLSSSAGSGSFHSAVNWSSSLHCTVFFESCCCRLCSIPCGLVAENSPGFCSRPFSVGSKNFLFASNAKTHAHRPREIHRFVDKVHESMCGVEQMENRTTRQQTKLTRLNALHFT